MTPKDFVCDAEYRPKAGDKELLILSAPGVVWEVLSYYYNEKTNQMVLDIQPRAKK